ncbi:unnamed protein product [Prorocentrum cordatum]|uniref:Pentatricopeptide repeat-containing protein n=1 Tax=Prorocentrum cordatum TaxID=2364126 RepID=A0ABN9SQ61_9DINO|nr:unnamed protein product [Polarella glacialis]
MNDTKIEPDAVSYNSGMSACDRAGQWQKALWMLFSEFIEASLEPTTISYSAGVSACSKGWQWQHALALLGSMEGVKLSPDAISSPTILESARAKEVVSGSGRCLC